MPRAQPPTHFTPQQALVTIVVAAMQVDGTIAPQETFRLQSICQRSPIFDVYDHEQLSKVIDFGIGVAYQWGYEAVTNAAASLSQELKETAFAFACEMIAADGIVTIEERGFLVRLRELLGVPQALADAIVRTVAIQQRGVE